MYLGKISFSLYLVHYVVLAYFTLLWRDVKFDLWVNETDDSDQNHFLLPLWGIPIVVVLSLGAAHLFEEHFVERARKWLLSVFPHAARRQKAAHTHMVTFGSMSEDAAPASEHVPVEGGGAYVDDDDSMDDSDTQPLRNNPVDSVDINLT